VLNAGQIEQAGPPRELYDAPANEFVMGFLGPVARLGADLVRPHDLMVRHDPGDGAVEAQVKRVLHLGFEVRVELELAGEGAVAAQLTRSEAEQLELTPGDIVYVLEGGRRSAAGAASAV
jgi:sulfate transport system ATP-binding protein